MKVQALAEGVIKFDAADLSSVEVEAPPAKKAKLSKAERRAKHAAGVEAAQVPDGTSLPDLVSPAAPEQPSALSEAPSVPPAKKSKKKTRKGKNAAAEAEADGEGAPQVDEQPKGAEVPGTEQVAEGVAPSADLPRQGRAGSPLTSSTVI